jgi:hypothetical protein
MILFAIYYWIRVTWRSIFCVGDKDFNNLREEEVDWFYGIYVLVFDFKDLEALFLIGTLILNPSKSFGHWIDWNFVSE